MSSLLKQRGYIKFNRLPKYIVSKNGTWITSLFMIEFCTSLGSRINLKHDETNNQTRFYDYTTWFHINLHVNIFQVGLWSRCNDSDGKWSPLLAQRTNKGRMGEKP